MAEHNSFSGSTESLPDLTDVIRHGKLREAGAAMFAEYCECSTIHGVRYLGERRRSWTEKIFWISIFAMSIYTCTYLIGNIWTKWNETPVIVSFSDRATPVWSVPFPTFTVCLDTKSTTDVFRFDKHVSQVEANSSTYDDWNERERKYFDASLQVCDYTKADSFDFTEEIFQGSFKETLLEMAPWEETVFELVGFGGAKTNVSGEYMDKVLTERGICYSFNLLSLLDVYRDKMVHEEVLFETNIKRSPEWTLENGFIDMKNSDGFPFRSYSAFVEHGLLLVMGGNIDDIDKVCGEGDEGFKFGVTTPGDVPQLSKQFFNVPFNYEVLVDITPELITTADEAAEYSPAIRHCFYTNERFLNFFKSYSQSNCELECLTNYTLQKCGCVRFNMPREKHTPVCGARKIQCYLDAKSELLENDFNSIVENSSRLNIPDCNCLPTCTSLTYNAGITQAPLDEQIVENNNKITKLQIYYKDNRFWSSERSKLYGIIEFTANAGGLLGLFMGISVISFIEIVYFFTVRLAGNLQLRCKARLKRISHIGVSMTSIDIRSQFKGYTKE